MLLPDIPRGVCSITQEVHSKVPCQQFYQMPHQRVSGPSSLLVSRTDWFFFTRGLLTEPTAKYFYIFYMNIPSWHHFLFGAAYVNGCNKQLQILSHLNQLRVVFPTSKSSMAGNGALPHRNSLFSF